MNGTRYTRADLDKEARYHVERARACMPRGSRRQVKAAGWELALPLANSCACPVLVVWFKDDAGLHAVHVAI